MAFLEHLNFRRKFGDLFSVFPVCETICSVNGTTHIFSFQEGGLLLTLEIVLKVLWLLTYYMNTVSIFLGSA